jgi:hypothetical protein
MRIWMIADLNLLEAMQAAPVLYCDPARISFPEFLPAYTWMGQQMALRIPCYHGHLPWWAWHQWEPGRAKPDLRARTLHNGFAPGAPLVRMELEIPAEEVTLSDFELWHFILNRRYLGWTEEEGNAVERAWKGRIPNEILEASWERIFLLHYPPEADIWLGAIAASRVQATFETLRLADVRTVTHCLARPPRVYGYASLPVEGR